MNPMGLVLVGVGLFSVVAAIQEWSFFMEHRKAQRMIWLLGRQGARAFYVVTGIVIMGAGGFLTIAAP
ncbi:MAG: immunity 17 family protein [Myxococcales bacterium]|nr:immunity 17 family protein [Myxococcales bacterium]MCB9668987.1 immunity 17 family protein [Alphaproteobacteria bacterium]MCB9691314.1 immunity 17 family protein [Alphaproteobacteria bacterium]